MKRKICLTISCCLLIIGLIGCEKKDPFESEVKNYAIAFLDGYIDQNENISNYFSGSGEKIKFAGFQEILAKQFKYSITGIDKVDDRYVVSLKATNADFGKVLENVVNECSDGTTAEKLKEMILSGLSDDSVPTKDFECTLNVEGNSKDNLTISITESLSNAMLGGYPEFIDNYIMQQFKEGE